MLAIFLAIPLATAVGFHFYTGEIWEDFFITFRHTENLVHGHGLVYQPGERVHGFTSVLNTLLPALPLLFSESVRVAVIFYGLCSLTILGVGLAALLRAMRERLGSSFGELGLVALLIALSIKIVAYATNGQEAGLLVGFWGLALSAVLRLEAPRQWLVLAASWAGLLYTRPDSPVYIAILTGIAWSLSGQRRADLPKLGKALGVALACYLPWLVIAWVYYGSPVPHTIIAKASGRLLVDDSIWATLQAIGVHGLNKAADIFGPIYQPGNWPGYLIEALRAMGLVALFYWAFPSRDRFGRACSAGLLVLFLYLSWVDVQRTAFPWYFTPAALLGAIVLARMFGSFWSGTGARRWVAGGVAGVAVVACGICLGYSFRLWRLQQVMVEEDTRTKIGQYLKQKAQPGDSVYLECLGYIGYYYGGKMLDFPGLVSPEVVKVLRQPGKRFADVPVHLRPTWIVARPDEAQAILSVPANKEAYDAVTLVDTRAPLAALGRFPGDELIYHDTMFVIFHRKAGIDAGAPSAP